MRIVLASAMLVLVTQLTTNAMAVLRMVMNVLQIQIARTKIASMSVTLLVLIPEPTVPLIPMFVSVTAWASATPNPKIPVNPVQPVLLGLKIAWRHQGSAPLLLPANASGAP